MLPSALAGTVWQGASTVLRAVDVRDR